MSHKIVRHHHLGYLVPNDEAGQQQQHSNTMEQRPISVNFWQHFRLTSDVIESSEEYATLGDKWKRRSRQNVTWLRKRQQAASETNKNRSNLVSVE